MLTEFVGSGAFLCSVFQVIRDRLASRVFIDYFGEEPVNKLEITLNSIKIVVEDAETKQYQNADVKNWLDDLKHELYELEQVLDVVAIDAQGKSKIGRFISGSINRYESRIKLLLERLNVLARQKKRLGLEEDRYEIQVSREFTNREREKEETMDSVFSNSYWVLVPIINIVGPMGGRVKTILSQFIFKEEFDIKVWVRVPDYFDLISVTRSIIKSIHTPALDDTKLDILKLELQNCLAGNRQFLIRDNVWNKDGHTWENLLLRFSGSGVDNMITITHDIEVASVIRSTQLLLSKQSEENDSWRLFVKHAFGSRNVFDYPNLELIAKKIVEKYRGFPFTLKTLGNLLRTKFNEREWVEILETPLWRLDEDDNNINSVLRLFYHNLCSNLKRCFAYCSIFPKGYEFDKDELIKLWMAEGLLKGLGSDQNEKELGNKFFDHLVSISFFQQSIIMPLWTGKYYFTMHDLVNDLANLVSGESCLRIEGENVQDILERTRHIWCCLDLKDGDRKLEHISKIEGLHSLMVEAQGYGDQRFKISTNVQQKLF